MVTVIEAIYRDGVFKPDRQPGITDNTRVRLVVEAADDETPGDAGASLQSQSWAALEQLWKNSPFDSQGDRLTRDALHERS